MAAYAATVALDSPSATALQVARGLKVITGTVDITNYNQTVAEVTGITKFFKSAAPKVICDGVSDNGYLVRWSQSDKSFKAYYPSIAEAAHSHTLYVATGATDAAGARVNAATNSFAMNNAAASIAGIPAASGAAGGVVQAAAIAAAPGTEVASDVDVGLVNFIAIGV